MKIGRFTIWTRAVAPHDAASVLGKHGAAVRRAAERERIYAKTRQIRRELGLPEHEALR